MPEKPPTVALEVPAELATCIQAMLDHVADFRSKAGASSPHFGEAEARLGTLVADRGNFRNLGALKPGFRGPLVSRERAR